MKNFLKSTAIFACIAMMFCACSEDTTEDAVSSASVPAAVIETVQPGKGTIVVKWFIPDDCDVDKSMITWKNLDGTTSTNDGQTNEFVREGASYTYTIGESIALTEVGYYEVSVTNVHTTSLKRSETVTETVLVYTDDTYKDSLPMPTGYNYSDEGGITIEWSDIDADCQGVVITYRYDDLDGVEQDKTTDLMPLTDGTTTLADAKIGTDFTYTAYFCPATAIEMVEITGGTGTISDLPDTVSSFTAYSGVDRMYVEWALPAAALEEGYGLEGVLVTYTNTSSEVFEAYITTDDMEFAETGNKSYISAPVGTYSVAMYIVRDGGFLSAAKTQSSTVLVYNESSFELPTILTIDNDENGEVTITWSTASNCESWYIKYEMLDGEMSKAIVVTDGEATVFTDAKEFGEIYIYATYCPSNGIDYIYLEGAANETIPAVAACTPVLAQPTTGYDDDNNSEINLVWTISNPEGLIKSIIYFSDNSAEEVVYTEISIVNPKLGENTYTLTADDGIEVSKEYNIYVRTMRDTADGTLSAMSEDYDVLAYNADEFSSSDLPTPKATLDETMDREDGYNAKVVWSGTKISYVSEAVIRYNGVEYTSVKETDESGDTSIVTYFPYVLDVTYYEYVSASFFPEGGMEAVIVEYTGSSKPTVTVTYPDPVAAANVTSTAVCVQEFVNGTGVSTVRVDWTSDAIVDHFELVCSAYTVDDEGNMTATGASQTVSVPYHKVDVTLVDDADADADVDVTYVYSYSFDVEDGLTYGTSVQSVSALGLTATATAEKYSTAYGTTNTYVGAPVVTSIGVVDGGDGIADVTWDNATSAVGLQSLVMTYVKLTDGVEEEVEVTANITAETGAIAITELPDAKEGSTITYTAIYCPTGGEGEIVYTVTSTAVVTVTYNPDAPTGLGLSSFGFDATTEKPYFNLAWTAAGQSGNVEATGYMIYYSADGVYPGDDTTPTVEIEDPTVVSYKLELDATELGNYTVFVKSVSGDGLLSDEYASISVVAYNSTSYSESDLPVAVSSYSPDFTTENVTIEWRSVSADVQSVTVAYENNTLYTGAIAEFDELKFTYNSLDNFTYTTNFAPVGGADMVSVVGTGSFVVTDTDIAWSDTDNAYYIYSARGLAAFADIVNGTVVYLTSSDLKAEGFTPSTTSQNASANAILKAPVDLSNICSEALSTSWTPIGPSTTLYKGTFDGGYYSVSNLYINATTAGQGLFGYLSAATVKNLVVKNPFIYSTNSTVGGIAASAVSSSLIENCSVYGTYQGNDVAHTTYDIEIGGGNSKSQVGGIIGTVSGGSMVVGCVNYSVTVKNSSANTSTTNLNSSGVVGAATGAYVIDCHNHGAILIDYDAIIASMGGVVGNVASSSYVIGCSNSGVVQGCNYTGAVTGYTTASTVIACQNSGNTFVGHGMGGICGRISTAFIYASYSVGNMYGKASTSNTYGLLNGNSEATSTINYSYGVSTSSANTNTVYTSWLETNSAATVNLDGGGKAVNTECYKLTSTADLNTASAVSAMNSSISALLMDINVELVTAGAKRMINSCSYAVGAEVPELTITMTSLE